MNAAEAGTKILDTMLGHLGFAAQIEVEDRDEGPCLQILTSQSKFLIGRDGHRLDDLQYLVNRVLRRHDPEAPRIKVDCEHYRTIHEDKLIEEVRGVAERVKASGKPVKLRPLNAYYRRLVHNALVDDSEIETHSPDSRERLKRITVRLKGGGKKA
jgi:spoIIIJ-associated protein